MLELGPTSYIIVMLMLMLTTATATATKKVCFPEMSTVTLTSTCSDRASMEWGCRSWKCSSTEPFLV